jgi:D-alanyl-D-alanine carboxypeptidase (penicillin-binding protein 5/6)
MITFLLLIFSFQVFSDTLSTSEIIGESAIIIDYRTGEVLWDKASDQKAFPASTTKIMTAIIILENHDLDELVTVSSNFPYVPGSSIAIDHEETFTVEQLLYATLVKSANDAAYAKEMNEKALEIGAVNTNFVNPHGLDDPNHYTTAYDLAMIARYSYNNDTFKKMVNTTGYIIPQTNKKNEERDYVVTSNKFLTGIGPGNQIDYNGQTINIKYDLIDGIKTGYTPGAGNCLVSTAQKNNERYITVVLRSNEKNSIYLDSRKLIDYAFKNFIRHQFVSEGSFIKTIEIKGDKKLRVNLIAESSLIKTLDKDTDITKIQQEILLNQNITSPIKAGEALGKITYYYENKPLGSISLVSEYEVNESNLVSSIETALIKRNENNTLDVGYYVSIFFRLLIAFIIYRSIMTYFNLKKRKKRIEENNLSQKNEAL